MKTNPPTSKFGNLLGTQASRLRLAVRKLFYKFRRLPNKYEIFLFLGFIVWVIFLLATTTSCKSPAILTNANDHHSRDSTYHANFERIETHDTIIIGLPTPSPFVGGVGGGPEGRGGSFVCRISDRTRTIHDTTFLLRTDTLIRTQTITQTERYIPPFYNFCTIAFVAFVAFVALYFSIRLLLRYLKIRSPT